MQVIPGSPLNARVPFRDSAADESNVLVQTVENPEDYGDRVVSLEMRAGQVSLRSDWILHGSPPNNSDRRRRGLAMDPSPPTCAPSTAETSTRSCAAVWNPRATGPTTPAPTANSSPPRTPARAGSHRPPAAAAAAAATAATEPSLLANPPPCRRWGPASGVSPAGAADRGPTPR